MTTWRHYSYQKHLVYFYVGWYLQKVTSQCIAGDFPTVWPHLLMAWGFLSSDFQAEYISCLIKKKFNSISTSASALWLFTCISWLWNVTASPFRQDAQLSCLILQENLIRFSATCRETNCRRCSTPWNPPCVTGSRWFSARWCRTWTNEGHISL